MKKAIGLAVVGALLSVGGIIGQIRGNTSVAVIGGADGPTAVYVSGVGGTGISTYSLVIGIVLFVVAGVVFFKNRH